MEGHPLDSCDDHLGDAHAARYLELLGTEIDQGHHQLAAVVAIDRGRGIGQRDAVPECQAGPRPELAFIPVWNGDAEAGPEELSLEGGQLTVFGAGQIVPGGPGGGRGRQGEVIRMGEACDQDSDRDLRDPLRQRC